MSLRILPNASEPQKIGKQKGESVQFIVEQKNPQRYYQFLGKNDRFYNNLINKQFMPLVYVNSYQLARLHFAQKQDNIQVTAEKFQLFGTLTIFDRKQSADMITFRLNKDYSVSQLAKGGITLDKSYSKEDYCGFFHLGNDGEIDYGAAIQFGKLEEHKGHYGYFKMNDLLANFDNAEINIESNIKQAFQHPLVRIYPSSEKFNIKFYKS